MRKRKISEEVKGAISTNIHIIFCLFVACLFTALDSFNLCLSSLRFSSPISGALKPTLITDSKS